MTDKDDVIKQAERKLRILAKMESLIEKNSSAIRENSSAIQQQSKDIRRQSEQIGKLMKIIKGDNGIGMSDHVRNWIEFREWWKSEKVGDSILLNTTMRKNIEKAFWLISSLIITNAILIISIIVAIVKYMK